MSPVRSWSERRKEAKDAPAGFKPLEPGVYNFVIKTPVEVSTNPNTQKTRWSMKATVEDGPRANSTQFHDLYDSDKPAGVSYLLDQLAALGLDSLIDTEPTDEAIGHALLGRRFTAEAFVDTYNGKEKIKLRNLRAPSGPAIGGALGAPSGFGGGPGAGPGGPSTPAPAFQQQQPVQQQAPAQQYQQPVQQQAPAQQQQPVQQYQQQAPAPAQPQATDNPWSTGGAPPLPQF